MKKRASSPKGSATVRPRARTSGRSSGGEVPSQASAAASAPASASPYPSPPEDPERARAEAEAEAEAARVRRLAAVGRATAAIAHDFNNLLAGIVGCADLALQELDPDLGGRPFVEELRAIALRGGLLTARLLDLERAQEREPGLVDLDAVVRRTESLVRGLLGENVRLTVASARRPIRVRMHAVEIEQILLNLAMNARRAMSRRGKLSIEISTTQLNPREMGPIRPSPSHRFALIEVSDDGAGMDAETRARAFEPYFSASLRTLGTGLGLATVREIVARRGGTVDLWSKVGFGTTVRMLLPIEPASAGEIDTPSPAIDRVPADRREATGARGSTVLLVEDDEACRMAFATFLKRRGHRVLAVGSAEDAHRMLAEAPGRVDVLLTDLGLTVESGDDLAEAVRAAHPEVVVVLMSGREPGSARVKRALRGPRTAFLRKPFELEELTRTIDMLRAAPTDHG